MSFFINISNFTSSPFSYALSPYVGIFGQFFFAFVLLVPAVYIYIQSDKNTWISAIYLLATSAVFTLIIPLLITSLMLILSAFVITGLLIVKLVGRRDR